MMMTAMALFIPALFAGQDDEKALKEKQTEVMAFAKNAKTERDFRAVTGDLEKLAEQAFVVNLYELAVKLYADAEKLARTALKDAVLALSYQESGKRIAGIGKEFSKASKAVGKILANEATPEDYTVCGRFLCFVKGDWALGLADLSKGKDEALKKLAEDDLAGANPIALADAWMGLLKKEPAAKNRALHWYSKGWPTLTGVSREKIRERVKSIQRIAPAKRNPIVGNWVPAPQPDGRWFDTEFAHTGKTSVGLTSGLAKQNATPAGIYQQVTVRPGAKISLRGWCMTDGTDGSDFMFFAFFDAEGKAIDRTGATAPADLPFWTRFEREITVPVGTVAAKFNMIAQGKQGTLWLDDVSAIDENGAELLKNGGFEGK